MTRLSDRLNDAKPGVNIRAAVDRAQTAGHAIDRGTVYRYLKGDHAKDPSDETLEALGFIFGVKVTELRELAEKAVGEVEPYRPPAYANRLNRDQRKALDELIRTIVETSVVVVAPTATATSTAPAPKVTGTRRLKSVTDPEPPEQEHHDAAAKKEGVEDWSDFPD